MGPPLGVVLVEVAVPGAVPLGALARAPLIERFLSWPTGMG